MMENQKNIEQLLLVIGLAFVLIKKRRHSNSGITTGTTNYEDNSTNVGKLKPILPALSEMIPSLLQSFPLKLSSSACIQFDIAILMAELKITGHHSKHIHRENYGDIGHSTINMNTNILQSLIDLNMSRIERNQLSNHIAHRIVQKIIHSHRFVALLITLSKLLCIRTDSNTSIKSSSASDDSQGKDNSNDDGNHGNVCIEDSIDINVLTIEATHRSILRLCSSIRSNSSKNSFKPLITLDRSHSSSSCNNSMRTSMTTANKKYIMTYERMGDLCSLLAAGLRQLKKNIITSAVSAAANNSNTKDTVDIANNISKSHTATAVVGPSHDKTRAAGVKSNNRSSCNDTNANNKSNEDNECIEDSSSNLYVITTTGMKEWMMQLLVEGVSHSEAVQQWPLVHAMYSSLVEELVLAEQL